MTKEQFIKQLDDSLSTLSLEEKIKVLTDIQNTWLNDYLSKITENKKFCKKCKKFSDKHEFKVEKKIHTEARLLGSYVVPYVQTLLHCYCPKCNNETTTVISSRFLTSTIETP